MRTRIKTAQIVGSSNLRTATAAKRGMVENISVKVNMRNLHTTVGTFFRRFKDQPMRERRKISPQSKKNIDKVFKKIGEDKKRKLAQFDANYDMLMENSILYPCSFSFTPRTVPYYKNGKTIHIKH